MAADIIPIQLGLTSGNFITLWAPRWIEDGEEWEAFLGHEDDLYGFPDAAHLAAFIRSTDDHDLEDHPEWDVAEKLLVDELVPDDDHCFDIVGVPDLVAEAPDIWTLAELSDIVSILRSVADVCDLEVITDLLDSAEGFSVLGLGERAFAGRPGERLWDEIGAAVVKGWDDVVDALDTLVATPAVNASLLAAAQAEAAATGALVSDAAEAGDEPAETDSADRDPDLDFWDGIGIDCIQVTVGERTGSTLRCYLGDDPLFLTVDDKVQVWTDDEALENFLADPASEHSMVGLEVWNEIREAIHGGDAVVVAGPENVYLLDGIADDLQGGPAGVDSDQLTLAIELLTDAATARRDEESLELLSPASSLTSLVTSITEPSADRLPPVPPYDAEAETFRTLVTRFSDTLAWDPTS